jgi:hypothetical protein
MQSLRRMSARIIQGTPAPQAESDSGEVSQWERPIRSAWFKWQRLLPRMSRPRLVFASLYHLGSKLLQLQNSCVWLILPSSPVIPSPWCRSRARVLTGDDRTHSSHLGTSAWARIPHQNTSAVIPTRIVSISKVPLPKTGVYVRAGGLAILSVQILPKYGPPSNRIASPKNVRDC